MSSPDPVTIVGGTGALGFGLALRLAREDVPVILGSRDAGRAAEAAAKASEQVAGGAIEGLANAEAVTRAETVVLCVPFRNQSENLTNLKDALRPGQLLGGLRRGLGGPPGVA